MYNCPKFDRCSAPICPLDPDWKQRSMLKGESTCFYLREVAKGVILSRYVPSKVAKVILEVYPDASTRYVPLKKALNRARKTSSKTTFMSSIKVG